VVCGRAVCMGECDFVARENWLSRVYVQKLKCWKKSITSGFVDLCDMGEILMVLIENDEYVGK